MSEERKSNAANLEDGALYYHRFPRPGKLEIRATKPLGNPRDLALAYSPGVAFPCLAIAKDPAAAADYTSRGNLVAVVSNGTAVLGLGAIGPLASKPVMEGKAVLFKKFAGIDVFDIEVEERDVDRFVDVVAALEPTFGGINLEDIKAPECFDIEAKLRERMRIPVFHDDQHGTAIIVGAAVRNAMEIAGKRIEDVKIVASGAGAAAIACLNLLVSLGANPRNIWVSDLEGVVYKGRPVLMDRWKEPYAQETDKRTLAEVIDDADIFLGVSAGGVLKPEMVARMAPNPLILALANPNPEIMPDAAAAVRSDAMVCTGRSDFPNQVNNVLCFPYIFRGALDVSATAINEAMKLAAVEAIAKLAQEPPIDADDSKPFGPERLIPSPFDQRLVLHIAPAVARAAMETGVATRPITDWEAYLDGLNRFVFRSGLLMKPIIAKAKQIAKRVVLCEGEDERVLRAVQIAVEDGIARPILVGRPSVVESRLERFRLKIRPGVDFELINPLDDPRYRDYVDLYFSLVGRRGITPDAARTMVRTNSTVIGALALRRGEADAMLCGLDGRFKRHLRDISQVVGLAPGVSALSTLSLLLLSEGAYFLADTSVQEDPSAPAIAEMTKLAVRHVRQFGVEPAVALLSHSNFGTSDGESPRKMREALGLILEDQPDLHVDGEMQGDSALSRLVRDLAMPRSRLSGAANLLMFPNLDAANIALTLLKEVASGLHVGPMLMGTARPAHILSSSATTRGVLNMIAVAAVEAGSRQ
ncbi:malate dehydrogenase (oxaloacetate-decarboxylating)(NADP+) [Pseudoxanthobacter soli DSM 19599]|uniref:Malate dehydrogenase (Oxaloacetate-decarboxylating)(NADP+) n=1 Tax=Pseudoxanthobacter soli DSM 19599 TaxID=1123029 RepID=A0A1M7Z8H4_9HYPH|nr:NADP-dependent malic enzyme [Pseudoxanthobacter soli]SHO61092.1 malate dehydrogenase (oxaloacetate-decarboxylating)(NADP+) [Pseudoxanthobacter soli DSM 19599]